MLSDNWLSAGSHTFYFHFNLPPRLPSTFTSKIGHVFYYVEASCMGREHILAKKRMYLLIQGTSDFHRENPLQVVMGKQWWGLSSKLHGGRGHVCEQGTGKAWQGRREGCWWLPRPSELTSKNQKPGQELSQWGSTGVILPPRGLGNVWEHLWLSRLGVLLALVSGGQGYCLSPYVPTRAPHRERSGPNVLDPTVSQD